MILNLSLQTDLSLCNPLLCSRFTMKAAIFPFEIVQSLHVSLWGDLLCLIQAPRQYIRENQGKGSNFLPLIHGNEIPYPRRLWWSNFLPPEKTNMPNAQGIPRGMLKLWFDWYLVPSLRTPCKPIHSIVVCSGAQGTRGIIVITKIQLVVYYKCCILIGWATTRLYFIADL